MYSKSSFLTLASLIAAIPSAFAGFSTSSQANVAIYWGQGPNQGTLASYCSNTGFDIVPVAFLTSIKDVTVNVGNADITQVGKDIITCQGLGKTILLSIGGATFTENALTSSSIATTAAQNIWEAFGPQKSGSTVKRPFGSAVVDGFDFDIESPGLDNLDVFAGELRTLMDAETSKKYYLTAAPQCPYPDQNDKGFLQTQVAFDAVFVQFYNNNCGLGEFKAGSTIQSAFNMATWDTWASTTSKNKDVKVFVGIPGSTAAAGSGYVDSATIAEIIAFSKGFKSFGGIMAWDMVTLIGNNGYLAAITKALGGAAPSGSTPASSGVASSVVKSSATVVSKSASATAPVITSSKAVTSSKAHSTGASTLITSVRSGVVSSKAIATATGIFSSTVPYSSGTSGTVPMWSQCGGIGYTGPTTCVSGSTCVKTDDYWSACQ